MTAPPRSKAARISPPTLLHVARAALEGFLDDKVSSMGAALAYYTLFSMAPLLLIAISVAGLAFGAEAARGEIVAQLSDVIGPATAQTVQSLLDSVSRPGQGVIGTIGGVLLMLFGATTVLAQLQDALDRIWHAPRLQGPQSVLALLRARLLSLGLILGLGFLIMVSMLASAALAALQKWFAPWLVDWGTAPTVIGLALNFGFVTVMCAMIYKLMPRVRVAWSDVWVGALVTATLFTLGRYLIGAYLVNSAVVSGFGAAGSLAAVLVWVYYSAQILLMGAEFTWAYTHLRGSRQHIGLSAPSQQAEVTGQAA